MMQADNYRHKNYSSPKQCPRSENYDDSSYRKSQPVRVNTRRGSPCCFCRTKVKCANMNDLNRGKLVPGRNSKRISYKSVVQTKELFGQQQELPINQKSSPKRQIELTHRSSPNNVALENRWKNKARAIRREDMIDEVVETVITWEALLPDGWREYTPKISNTIEKVYRRVRALDLEDSDEKKCWQEESYYYQFKQYRISPHFMLQRNMKTGKDRKIRRKKVQLNSKAKHVRPKRKVGTSSRGNSTSYSKGRSEQKHSPPALPLKHHIKKRRKKPVKRRYADSDSKYDVYDNKDSHNDGIADDTNLTLNFNNYSKWETAHVVSWLRILNFPQYCEIVQEKGITGKVLSNAGITYFVTELKMSVEHATHIFGALEGIKSGFTEHGDDSCNSRFSSLSGQGNTSCSREMKYPIYGSSFDESKRESMIFKKMNEMDGIFIGSVFDKTKMTPTSEGNSFYSVNDSQILWAEQGRKLSMRSVNLEDRHKTSISAEQKKSKSSKIDDNLYLKESSLYDIEKEAHLTRRRNLLTNHVDISKRVNSYGSFTKDDEDTEIQIFGKDQSISSGYITQKINSRSESPIERNTTTSHKKAKELVSKGDGSFKEESFNIERQGLEHSHAAHKRYQQEYAVQSSLQPEIAAVRERLMAVKLKHVDDTISDNEENATAEIIKRFDVETKPDKKHSQEFSNTYLDYSSSFSPLKKKVVCPDIARKVESGFNSPGESMSSLAEINGSQKISGSLSVIVRHEY